MYIWNIDKLKNDLISNNLSQRAVLIYVLLYVAPSVLILEIEYYSSPNENSNSFDFLLSVLIIIITIFGTIYTYFKNGASHGVSFAERYFSIGFVVLLRMCVFILPVMLFIYLYIYWDTEEVNGTTWQDVLVVIGFQLFFYWRVGHHMGSIFRNNLKVIE